MRRRQEGPATTGSNQCASASWLRAPRSRQGGSNAAHALPDNDERSLVADTKGFPDMPPSLDPITVELIRNFFKAICDEMAESLIRSSHSPNIKERRDCSCSLYDAQGEMAVQAEHIPTHLGVMPQAMRVILADFPVSEMAPGDSFVV